MKDLKDFEEDLYKCSRCALCQSVCPVYKASLNECAVSKGKFNMLNGVIKGDLSVTKQMKKYLDMCTGCNACKNFCPSSIDAREIIRCAKNEYYCNNKLSLFEKVINSYNLLKFVLVASVPCFALYRLFRVDFFVRLFERFLLGMGGLGTKILLLNYVAKACSVKNIRKYKREFKGTVVFFDGCVNKYVNPITEKAVANLLYQAGYHHEKRNFDCCGVAYFNDGNTEEFKKVINKNIKQLKKDFSVVVTDCASCNDVLKNYKNYSNNPIAEKLSSNTFSVLEFIKDLKFKSKKNLKIAVHKPCHEDYDISSFLKNVQGIEFVDVKDFDKCCGFSGTFALKNQEISKKISLSKAECYIESNVDIVLTTCPSCMIGLEQGFIATKLHSKRRPKVMNLFVFLAEFCEIL